MIKYLYIFFIFIISVNSYSQAPSFSFNEIDSINNDSLAYEGDIYRDYDNNTYYIGTGDGTLVLIESKTKAVVLNRSGGSLPTANNTYFDFPVNSSHITTISSNYFSVLGNGRIQVLDSGVYMISASLSCSNLPSGGTKYILGVYINGTLSGYLSRGFVTLPSTDFWGTSGSLMFSLNNNDIISIRYVLNAGGSTLNARFSNIGVAKL